MLMFNQERFDVTSYWIEICFFLLACTQVPSSDSGQPTVTEIMDTWTKQKGYPVVRVDIHSDNTATLSQQRFLGVPSEDPNVQSDDG